MPNPNDVGIHAIWDNKDFVKGMKQYQSGLKSAGKATTTAAAQTSTATSGLGQMAGAMKVVGALAGGYMASQLVVGTIEIVKMGAQSKQVRESFQQLAASMGGNADEILKSLQEASAGTIANSELMLAANKAMMLGLGSDAKELGNLLEVARFQGRMFGRTTTEAFNDIVTGLGRVSPLILDNIGITLDSKKVYEEYAKSIGKTAAALTDAEKKQALMTATLADGNRMIEEAGGLVLTTAEHFMVLDAKMQNAKESLGEIVIETGAVDLALESLIVRIELLDDAVGAARNIGDFITSLGMAGVAADVLGDKLDSLLKMFKDVAIIGGPQIYTLKVALEALNISLEDNSAVTDAATSSTKSLAEAQAILAEAQKELAKAQEERAAQEKKLYDAAYKLFVAQEKKKEEFRRAEEESIQAYHKEVRQLTKDFQHEQVKAEQEYQQELSDTINDYHQQRLADEQQFLKSQEQAAEEYHRNVAQATQSFLRDQAAAMRDFQRDEAKAQRDYQRQLHENVGDFGKDEAKTEQGYWQDRLDTASGYSKEALQTEVEHQKKSIAAYESHMAELAKTLRSGDMAAYQKEMDRYLAERKKQEAEYAALVGGELGQELLQKEEQYAALSQMRMQEFLQELADAKAEAEYKRQERRLEFEQERADRRLAYEQKMRDMAEEAEYEKRLQKENFRDQQAAAKLAHEQQLAEMAQAEQQQKQARTQAYQEQLAEMRTEEAGKRQQRLVAFQQQLADEQAQFIEQQRIAAGHYDRTGTSWNSFLGKVHRGVGNLSNASNSLVRATGNVASAAAGVAAYAARLAEAYSGGGSTGGGGGGGGGGGFQHGGAFTVPAGFPNDTFPIRVSSGETVVVTPPGKSAGGLMEVNVNINGSGNFDAAFKREVITVVRDVVGEAIRA